MKRKHLIAALLLALAGLVPAWAVFKEKDLPQTLSVLHFELRNTYEQLERTSKGASQFEAAQHKRLVELIEHCNELSIMLYSQQQDFSSSNVLGAFPLISKDCSSLPYSVPSQEM